jgi:hypothetical protein
VAWSEADASLCCSNSTPFNSRPHYVVNNMVNIVVKNEVRNKGIYRKVVQKGKKKKGLDKGNGIIIEYGSVLARKRNGKGGVDDRDEVT